MIIRLPKFFSKFKENFALIVILNKFQRELPSLNDWQTQPGLKLNSSNFKVELTIKKQK